MSADPELQTTTTEVGGGDTLDFPMPKHTFHIFCPREYIVKPEDSPGAASDAVRNMWHHGKVLSNSPPASPRTSGSPKAPDTPEALDAPKPTKVKMASLVTKMINKLMKQNVIAHDRVFFSYTSGNMAVRILVGDSAISILSDRCAELGIGTVVGMVYVAPLEYASTPSPLAEKQNRSFKVPKSSGWEFQAGDITSDASLRSPGTGSTELVDHDEIYNEVSGEEDSDHDSTSPEETTDPASSHSSQGALGKLHEHELENRRRLEKEVEDAKKAWLDTGSRVRVAQVLDGVKAQSAFTFDYLAYVITAAWVAAFGLITDNVAVVIASMLLSPIMGPVLGGTFACVIQEWKLAYTSFRNELISLIVCVIVGGIIIMIMAAADAPDVQNFPSEQITSRGTVEGLIIGVFIALPSGMAVALSTLGRNSGGITGAAISLSLLPPAVNAGVCWFYDLLLKTGSVERVEGDDTNYAAVGGYSFALTIVNIGCIWLGATFMFKLKEVSPYPYKNPFWSHDIKIHRKKDKGTDTSVINRGIKAKAKLQSLDAAEGKLRDFNKESFKTRSEHFARHWRAANPIEGAFATGKGSGAGPDPNVHDVAARPSLNADSSLVKTANAVGGMEKAGEMLFS